MTCRSTPFCSSDRFSGLTSAAAPSADGLASISSLGDVMLDDATVEDDDDDVVEDDVDEPEVGRDDDDGAAAAAAAAVFFAGGGGAYFCCCRCGLLDHEEPGLDMMARIIYTESDVAHAPHHTAYIEDERSVTLSFV